MDFQNEVALSAARDRILPRPLAIRDKRAIRESLAVVMACDFDRIVPGHGRVIESDGKAKLARALADAGRT